MNKTVDELLQMIHDRIAKESEGFAKTGALRRLAKFRQVIGSMKSLQVNIPKPTMSKSGRRTLKNSPRASSAPSKRKTQTKVADKPTTVTVVAESKPEEDKK